MSISDFQCYPLFFLGKFLELCCPAKLKRHGKSRLQQQIAQLVFAIYNVFGDFSVQEATLKHEPVSMGCFHFIVPVWFLQTAMASNGNGWIWPTHVVKLTVKQHINSYLCLVFSRIPEEASTQQVEAFITACIHENPKLRPTAKQAFDILRTLPWTSAIRLTGAFQIFKGKLLNLN